MRHEVHIFDTETGEDRSVGVGQYIGAVAPSKHVDLVVAMHHGFARLDVDSIKITPITDPESDLPDNRFNDGKCDPKGRFWAGTMQLEGKARTGALYRLDGDLSVHRLMEGVGISNGLAWAAVPGLWKSKNSFRYARSYQDMKNT